MHQRTLGLLILNLLGTFIFGLSGGILAVRKRLDLFGVLVLAAAGRGPVLTNSSAAE
ncbi:MAG TPA: TRIC cation channel family protein [Candidatus Binataceae bacterium]